MFTKYRRDRWVSQVIKNGERLNSLHEYRAGLSTDFQPEEATFTDGQINRLERRRDSLLSKLRETA